MESFATRTDRAAAELRAALEGWWAVEHSDDPLERAAANAAFARAERRFRRAARSEERIRWAEERSSGQPFDVLR